MTESTPLRCIVGLGNPGPKYAQTRHNVGFWFIDELARRHNVALRSEGKFFAELARIDTPNGECWLLKPQTFMNHSGRAVNALMNFYKIAPQQLLVVHDELDLVAGCLRLKRGGGHGGHNGLRDICAALGKDFGRLRVGIGHPGHKDAVVDYVLTRPSQGEQAAIDRGLDVSLTLWEQIQAGEWQAAMNALHAST